MINSYNYKSLSWTDADSPSEKELTELVSKYKLHPIIGEELRIPTRKPKIEMYDNYIFLALHIPLHKNAGHRKSVVEKEIDFVIGKDFIITSHEGVIEPLHSFAKTFETNSIVDKKGIGNHAGVIFYYIIKRLYDNVKNSLDNIKDSLEKAEHFIFSGREKDMVKTLSEISRELIDFKRTTRLHKDILESFKDIPEEFFGKDFNYLIEDIQHTYASIHDLISSNKELLTDLKETNDSLLSTKQNESLKLFSALAFVTFPLSLLVGIFSLPTSHTPIIGSPYDWEILAGSIAVLALAMIYFFKKKDWI